MFFSQEDAHMITVLKTKGVLVAVSVLLFSQLACNMSGGQVNDLVATITAQAMALQTPTEMPAAPGDTPTATPTSAPSVPMVSVTVATNCRTGPGTAYDQVFAFNPGQSAQIVGKYTPGNYWIINMPGGGTCWLWGQYAVVSGDTSGLPEYPVPPTPTPQFTSTPKPTATLAPPKAPSNLSGAYDRTCAGGYRGITPIWIEDVTLTWTDNANNETGYRVYKNGSPLPDFPPNSTTFHISLRYDQGTGGALFDNFGVEAFNSSGPSARTAVDVPRCP
jgi:hypothetical protein